MKKDKTITQRIKTYKISKINIQLLEDKTKVLIKEVERVAVIRQEEVVVDHIIIPIQITSNRIITIVNTLVVEELLSTKRAIRTMG